MLPSGGTGAPCVLELYLRVYERFRTLRAVGDARELQSVLVNLNALAGPSRIAAALAVLDVEYGRPARSKADLYRAVYVATAGEEHLSQDADAG